MNMLKATVNRGLGAGGAMTNVNGLAYETLTDLKSMYTHDGKFVTFHGYTKRFRCLTKSSFLKEVPSRSNVKPMHGCKQPDESYVNLDESTIFIIEKKFQQTSGSVCEKIQTGDAKRFNFQQMFPTYEIHYTYCLSDWFRENCVAELDYLSSRGISVFWGSDPDYKNKMTSYINA